MTELIGGLEDKQSKNKAAIVDRIKKSEKYLAEKHAKMSSKFETELKTVNAAAVVNDGAQSGPSRVNKPPKVKVTSRVGEKEFATLIKVLKLNLGKETLEKGDVCMTLPKEMDDRLPYSAFYQKLISGKKRLRLKCVERLKVLDENEMLYFLTWMPRYEDKMASESRATGAQEDPQFESI